MTNRSKFRVGKHRAHFNFKKVSTKTEEKKMTGPPNTPI